MNIEFFNELKNIIKTSSNKSGEMIKVDNNTYVYDVFGDFNLLLWYDPIADIIAMNIENKQPMLYRNLKEFFHDLETYDKDSTIKAFLYLKGVTEDITNEQLFNQ